MEKVVNPQPHSQSVHGTAHQMLYLPVHITGYLHGLLFYPEDRDDTFL
jgi:hypothetical protein